MTHRVTVHLVGKDYPEVFMVESAGPLGGFFALYGGANPATYIPAHRIKQVIVDEVK